MTLSLSPASIVCWSTLAAVLAEGKVSVRPAPAYMEPPLRPPPADPQRRTGLNTIDHGRFVVLPTIQVSKEPVKRTKPKKVTKAAPSGEGCGGVLNVGSHSHLLDLELVR